MCPIAFAKLTHFENTDVFCAFLRDFASMQSISFFHTIFLVNNPICDTISVSKKLTYTVRAMIKLNPIHIDKLWGYEKWVASTFGDGSQKEFFDKAGSLYPLVAKILQIDSVPSVKIHPDDFFVEHIEADEYHIGQTECWYILDAKPDSRIVYGFNGEYSEKELRKAIEKGKLEKYFNYVNVVPGDFIYIPAGTVHCLGAGLRVLEIQQACGFSYRMYDFNRGRELDVKKALMVIKNGNSIPVYNYASGEFSCAYFTLLRYDVSGTQSVKAEKNWKLIFVVKSDKAVIIGPEKLIVLNEEDVIALAPGELAQIKGDAQILEIQPA